MFCLVLFHWKPLKKKIVCLKVLISTGLTLLPGYLSRKGLKKYIFKNFESKLIFPIEFGYFYYNFFVAMEIIDFECHNNFFFLYSTVLKNLFKIVMLMRIISASYCHINVVIIVCTRHNGRFSRKYNLSSTLSNNS